MKQIPIIFCLIILCVACQDKKYNPDTYRVETTTDDELSGIRNKCLTFMNYCDKNYSSDLKLFLRDFLRTWKEWKSDGIRDYSNVESCHIERNVNSIHVAVWHRDDEPPFFKAEYNFFSDNAYENLMDMAQQEFGEPDEEKETEYGTIWRWHVNDVKTISVVPDHWETSFTLKYILEQD